MECYTLSRVDKRPKIWYNRKKQKEGKKMATYSKEFKEEAIRLSDEIGNKKAAAQLGIPYYTLADWRNNSKHPKKVPETLSEEELRIRNRELERENAELREANNILKDALGFFAKDRKR